jgi:hypothetical protein
MTMGLRAMLNLLLRQFVSDIIFTWEICIIREGFKVNSVCGIWTQGSVRTGTAINGNSAAPEPRQVAMSWSFLIVRTEATQYLSVLGLSSDVEATLFYWYLRHRKQKRNKYWVHPFFTSNLTHSSFVIARELDQYRVKYHNFYRMGIESFKLLVQIVGPDIRKKDTNFRKAVIVEDASLQLSYKQGWLSTAWTDFILNCGSSFILKRTMSTRQQATINWSHRVTSSVSWKQL